MKLRDSEEKALMARTRLVLRRLADAWDPTEDGEGATLQSVSKNLLKEAAELSRELDRFE